MSEFLNLITQQKWHLTSCNPSFIEIEKITNLIISQRGVSPVTVCRSTITLYSEGHRPDTIEKQSAGAMPLQRHLSNNSTNGARANTLFTTIKSVKFLIPIKAVRPRLTSTIYPKHPHLPRTSGHPIIARFMKSSSKPYGSRTLKTCWIES